MRDDDLKKITDALRSFTESNECVLSSTRANELWNIIGRLRDLGPVAPRSVAAGDGKQSFWCTCGLNIDVGTSAPSEAVLVRESVLLNTTEKRRVLECPHCQVLWVERAPGTEDMLAYRPSSDPLRYWEEDVRRYT